MTRYRCPCGAFAPKARVIGPAYVCARCGSSWRPGKGTPYSERGKKGAAGRNASLSPDQRRQLASNAAKARWAKKETANG